jgi:P27 family predicted phage terminase small subunit
MAKGGLKPTPTALNELRGNPGRRKHPKPVQPRGELLPPDDLGEEEREVWDYLIAHQAPGVYTSVDQHNLAAFCVSVVLLRKARKEFYEGGCVFTVQGQRGIVKNPLVNLIREYIDTIRHLGADLGLLPTARARLVAAPEAKNAKSESPLRNFLNTKKSAEQQEKHVN